MSIVFENLPSDIQNYILSYLSNYSLVLNQVCKSRKRTIKKKYYISNVIKRQEYKLYDFVCESQNFSLRKTQNLLLKFNVKAGNVISVLDITNRNQNYDLALFYAIHYGRHEVISHLLPKLSFSESRKA